MSSSTPIGGQPPQSFYPVSQASSASFSEANDKSALRNISITIEKMNTALSSNFDMRAEDTMALCNLFASLSDSGLRELQNVFNTCLSNDPMNKIVFFNIVSNVPQNRLIPDALFSTLVDGFRKLYHHSRGGNKLPAVIAELNQRLGASPVEKPTSRASDIAQQSLANQASTLSSPPTADSVKMLTELVATQAAAAAQQTAAAAEQGRTISALNSKVAEMMAQLQSLMQASGNQPTIERQELNDLKAENQALKQQVASLSNQVDNLFQQLTTLSQRVASSPSTSSASAPSPACF